MRVLDERFLAPSPEVVEWMASKDTCRECRHVYKHHEHEGNEVLRCKRVAIGQNTPQLRGMAKARALWTYCMDAWAGECGGRLFEPVVEQRAERPAQKWLKEHGTQAS